MEIEKVLNDLEKKGFHIIPMYPIENKTVEQIEEELIGICKKIGKPIGHDKHGKIVWDIKVNESHGSVITYSEHSHEADLHTDSQYSPYPEDYFALLTLQKAKCGGGMSFILTLDDILMELESSKDGERAKSVLETTEYPFIVPDVFKKNNTTEPEIVKGKILKSNEIRFRVDTIRKALEFSKDLCSDDQIWAFEFLVDLVRKTKKTQKFYLEEGDLIFINNKTTLHGRSSFVDINRHLLRIRMNKY